jgi:hypothetical protein
VSQESGDLTLAHCACRYGSLRAASRSLTSIANGRHSTAQRLRDPDDDGTAEGLDEGRGVPQGLRIASLEENDQPEAQGSEEGEKRGSSHDRHDHGVLGAHGALQTAPDTRLI